MRRIGVHTSIAGGLPQSLLRARELGCSTVQIFSHNPRGWRIKERNGDEYEAFKRLRKKHDISPVFVHSSYLINLASPRADLRRKSVDMVAAEMDIADSLDADYVILHTGSASGEDPVAARERAISCLAEVSARGWWRSGILLENTAGKRGDIASGIEAMGEILEAVPGDLVSGVCIDTCHAFSAGYDMRTAGAADSMVQELRDFIGINRVKLIHVNDSREDLGSGVDRHEHIGRGRIGMEGIGNVLMQTLLVKVPLILETPKREDSDDRRNLSTVRELIMG